MDVSGFHLSIKMLARVNRVEPVQLGMKEKSSLTNIVYDTRITQNPPIICSILIYTLNHLKII